MCPVPAGRNENIAGHQREAQEAILTAAACLQGCTAEWGGHTPAHPAIGCRAAFKSWRQGCLSWAPGAWSPGACLQCEATEDTTFASLCLAGLRGFGHCTEQLHLQPGAILMKTTALQVPAAPCGEGGLVCLLCWSAPSGPQWGAAGGPVPARHPAPHLQRSRLPHPVHAGRAGCEGDGAAVAGCPPSKPVARDSSVRQPGGCSWGCRPGCMLLSSVVGKRHSSDAHCLHGRSRSRMVS